MSDTKFQQMVNNAGSSFEPTCWTAILEAGKGNSECLADFCQLYWCPLYAYARRSGKSVPEAQDMTQGFFTSLLEKGSLSSVKEGKGRFRNFLLILFKRYMVNEYSKSQRQKRGGGLTQLDFDEFEESLIDSRSLTPDESYDYAWAVTLLQRVLADLKASFKERGQEDYFTVMQPYLDGTSQEKYKDGAKKLNCTEGAFKVSVHRLRKEYGKVLRRHIGATLDIGEDIQEDIQEELNQLSLILKKNNIQ